MRGSTNSGLANVASDDDDSGFLTAIGTDALLNGAQDVQDASSMIPTQPDLPAPPEPAQPSDNPPIMLENPDPPSAPDPGPSFDSSSGIESSS